MLRQNSAKANTEPEVNGQNVENESTSGSPGVDIQRELNRLEEIILDSPRIPFVGRTLIDEEQLFYLRQRGLNEEDGVNLLVSGFCKEVFQKLPMEFAVEANKLLEVSMEGSVG